MTAVSFVSNLSLPKCMEFLYADFLQRNLCPVCMPLIDFVKFGWTFHSGSACVFIRATHCLQGMAFFSQSYPILATAAPGKEITESTALVFCRL